MKSCEVLFVFLCVWVKAMGRGYGTVHGGFIGTVSASIWTMLYSPLGI